MPPVVVEDPDGRNISIGRPASSQRRLYTVRGAPSYGEAVEALAAFAPGSIDLFEGGAGQGLFFIPRVKVDAIPAPGVGIWKGFADYSSFGPDEFSFEIGGGTEHILLNDRGQTFRYGAGGEEAPDFKGLIGVNGDNIDGCDIPPNNLSEQYHKKKTFLPGQINEGYIALLNTFRNAVNDAPFYGLQAGEALFLGVAGRTQGNEWELNFRWAGAENRTNVVLPGRKADGTPADIEIPSVHGWDYLWTLSRDFEDSTAKDLVKAPIAAYVERWAVRKNFGLLGIGTGLP